MSVNKIPAYRTDGLSGGSGTSIGLGKRTYSTTQTSPAGQGEIRFNAGLTEIYLHEDDLDGTDRSSLINKINQGSIFKVYKVSDPEDNFKTFEVTSQTDNTGSHTLVVTELESVGSFVGSDELSVDVDLKENPDGLDSKIIGTPEDNDNTNGFFQGLLTLKNNTSLLLRTELDEIVRRIKLLESALGANVAPVASSVLLTGMPETESNIILSYDYSDVDGDVEDQSGTGTQYEIISYPTEADAIANNGTIIDSGVTNGSSLVYSIQLSQRNNYIAGAITPRAQSGVIAGTKVYSNHLGPIQRGVPTFSLDKDWLILTTSIRAIENDGTYFYVGYSDRTLEKRNISDGTLVDSITLSTASVGIAALSKNSTKLYAVGDGISGVWRIDLATFVEESYTLITSPNKFLTNIQATDTKIYVSNGHDDKVVEYNIGAIGTPVNSFGRGSGLSAANPVDFWIDFGANQVHIIYAVDNQAGIHEYMVYNLSDGTLVFSRDIQGATGVAGILIDEINRLVIYSRNGTYSVNLDTIPPKLVFSDLDGEGLDILSTIQIETTDVFSEFTKVNNDYYAIQEGTGKIAKITRI